LADRPRNYLDYDTPRLLEGPPRSLWCGPRILPVYVQCDPRVARTRHAVVLYGFPGANLTRLRGQFD